VRAGFLFFEVPSLPPSLLETRPPSSASTGPLDPFPSLWVLLSGPGPSPATILCGPAAGPWGLGSVNFGIWVSGSFHFLAPVLELNSYISPVTRGKKKYSNHIKQGFT
jgi:hypothetical protein